MKNKLRNLRLLSRSRQGIYTRPTIRTIQRKVRVALAARFLIRLIIFVDSLALFCIVVVRRVQKLGVHQIIGDTHLDSRYPVVYLDIGTHQDASELRWMSEQILPKYCNDFISYGFEASGDCFVEAVRSVEGLPRTSVVQFAIVNGLADKVKLFRSGNDGIGNSLYRVGKVYEEVPAIRLSSWLYKNGIDLDNRVCLVRMNIEGAEADVIEDLIENKLIASVDGFFGVWDDVMKTDKAKGEKFEALLRREGIEPLTFHGGRDLGHGLRRMAIEYDICTRLRLGVRRCGNAAR